MCADKPDVSSIILRAQSIISKDFRFPAALSTQVSAFVTCLAISGSASSMLDLDST